MTKVLWFSRHEMTTDQYQALVNRLGDIELNQINKTISSAYELQDDIADCDVIGVVAPINLQSQFLKLAGDKPVITAKSRRVFPNDGTEGKVNFVFEKWERIRKIEVVFEDF